jgi:hypothetical protein
VSDDGWGGCSGRVIFRAFRRREGDGGVQFEIVH